jgi:hypothetical protein
MTLRQFLGAFAKLQKVMISFAMSACLSVRMEQVSSHWMEFYVICYLSIFRKSVKKSQAPLKAGKNNGYFV